MQDTHRTRKIFHELCASDDVKVRLIGAIVLGIHRKPVGFVKHGVSIIIGSTNQQYKGV